MKKSTIVAILLSLAVIIILFLLPGKSITIVTDPEKAARTEMYNELLQLKVRLLTEKVELLGQEVVILQETCPFPDEF